MKCYARHIIEQKVIDKAEDLHSASKKYAQSLKLKNEKEWKQHTKSKNFPKDIPAKPRHTYKKEWKGMKIFLGNNKKS